jgi:hypothetical protein
LALAVVVALVIQELPILVVVVEEVGEVLALIKPIMPIT